MAENSMSRVDKVKALTAKHSDMSAAIRRIEARRTELSHCQILGWMAAEVDSHGYVRVGGRVVSDDDLVVITQFLVDCVGRSFCPNDFSGDE